MTWLSRLLPQSSSLQRVADHKFQRRAQQGRRRRLMANLDTLEARTLLSNVTTAFVAHQLVITGDTHNDSFSVTENNATGQITVVGTAAPNPTNPHLPALNTTQINGLPVGLAYTTSQAVQSIEIILPGNFNNTDNVAIAGTGTGAGTLASVTVIAPGVTGGAEGLDLSLTVTNLSVSGAFSLYDAPTSGATGINGAQPPLPAGQAANAPAGYVFPTVANPHTGTGASPTVPSNNLGGVLTASVTGSHLGSLYIEQDGCCVASVAMDHDAVSGSVTVEEGVANGDKISLTNSTAGATVLTQGYGPTMAGCNGSGNLVTVQDDPVPAAGTATTGIFSLAITQLGPGSGAKNAAGQTILVGTVSPVEVALTGFGITATQHDGSGVGTGGGTATGNLINIESITVYGHLTNSFGPGGPPSIVTSQGDGSSDSTDIDSSTVWGNISASQGNGGSDSIFLAADTAGFTVPGAGGLLISEYGLVTLKQGDGGSDTVTLNSAGSEFAGVNVFNNLAITQGNGGGDMVTVDSTTVVTGNITVCQGNGAGDIVNITASMAGYTTTAGPLLVDHGGLLAVVQGNGYEDMITITSVGTEGDFGSVFNNVMLVQGDSLNGLPVDCLEPTGDIICIDQTTINSNLLIYQNAHVGGTWTGAELLVANPSAIIVSDGPGLGNNVVDIGTGLCGPGTVYVGEETYIFQGGANNTVVMGGSGGGAGGPDFETGFLDIWTGKGGGGTVYAINTTVVFGSYFGWNYVINGGGAGNTYIDGGNNSPDPLPYGPGYSG